MYISGNPHLGHSLNDGVSLRLAFPRQTGQIQVAAGGLPFLQMAGRLHAPVLQQAVIQPHQFTALFQQRLIPAELHQADGRGDIRHIALIERRGHVVFPAAQALL